MYMIHVIFEHQENDFVEIHSPTTAVSHEQSTINDFVIDFAQIALLSFKTLVPSLPTSQLKRFLNIDSGMSG